MKDIGLLKFGTPDDFGELRGIVKLDIEQDSAWAEELEKVTDIMLG
jgi:hypothetical protein